MTIHVVIFDLKDEEDKQSFEAYKKSEDLIDCLNTFNAEIRNILKYDVLKVEAFFEEFEETISSNKILSVLGPKNKIKKKDFRELLIDLYKDAMLTAYHDAHSRLHTIANDHNVDIL